MPLIRYFGFVGSALVLLLVGIDWCLPQPAAEPIQGDTERPAIRITSLEPLPERVVIDTSLPTILAPPSVSADPSISSESTNRSPQSASAELDVSPIPAAPRSVGEVSKTKHIAKREPAKRVISHRPAQPLNIVPAGVQGTAPDTRMSLLETLKERLGQTFFKVN
ncbi:hypothetical protein [Bradyrhizobium cytisi]|uniref:Uncharacterized protein n=1 Tax=Bradyrhizobium cytisi TaxID=515489 RepID=A0A5S4W7M3_9BRAD|nr:hypothetical protein [Bradyrhizobium cytisi]TYL76758.1 hypothetical protein FXB38_30685 [Bradyrhizobium cytisi]